MAPSSPPPCALLNCTDPGPKPQVTPPQYTPHYPNTSPHARRSRNLSHHGSIFDFQPKASPPHIPLNCADPGPEPRVTPPQSTPHYPNPSPRTRRSRNPSPHVSVFDFQPKTSPSRVPLNCADPGPELRVIPPQSTAHYPNPSPRTRRSRNPSPHSSVFGFQPKTSPPVSHSIARTQDPSSGLPHPNLPSTTQIRAPSHVAHEN